MKRDVNLIRCAGETQGMFNYSHLGYRPSVGTEKFLGLTIYNLLKILDTIGVCQRPVFPLGVFQHMHKNKPVQI